MGGGGRKRLLDRFPPFGRRVVPTEAVGFKMHLEAVGNGTVAILCGCLCGSLLALYPKQGHGWRGSRCCHWQQVLQEVPPSWGGMLPHDVTARWFTDQWSGLRNPTELPVKIC